MDKITFEQLPQAVSLLIEKVGQLADKVDEALGKATQQKGRRLLALDDVAALLVPWMMSQPCSASPLPPSTQ